jgi:hypothetical protein
MRRFLKQPHIRSSLAFASASLLALASPVNAVDIDYQVGVSALSSNNIALSNTNTVDDTVLSPQIRFDASQAGSVLNLKARGEYQYLDYLDNTFGNESRSEFAGQLEWMFLPQRLHFVVEDYLSSQPTDVLTAFTPGNQQQINVFTAGPRFFARLGEATRAQAELRYSNTWAEETKEFNGDRYGASARLLRDIDSSRHVGINAEASQVRFDRAQSVDYERYDAFASYNEERERITMGLDLGYSKLNRDDGRSNDSAPLLRANVEWAAGTRSTLSTNINYEFADAAGDVVSRASLIDGPIIGTLSNAELLANAEVFRQTRFSLGYRYVGERWSVQASPYYQRINYQETLTPDQTSRGGFAAADVRLRPLLSLGAQTVYERRRFATPTSRVDRDYSLQLAITQELTRHWLARLGFQRNERNSDDRLQSYNENQIFFDVFWRR